MTDFSEFTTRLRHDANLDPEAQVMACNLAYLADVADELDQLRDRVDNVELDEEGLRRTLDQNDGLRKVIQAHVEIAVLQRLGFRLDTRGVWVAGTREVRAGELHEQVLHDIWAATEAALRAEESRRGS